MKSIWEEGICSSQEAKCCHQHEVAIWDRKLEIAQLQAVASPSFVKPNPAPTYENMDGFGSMGEMSGQLHSPYSSSPSSSGLCLSPHFGEGDYGWGGQADTKYSDLMGSG